MLDAILLEQQGMPAIAVITEPFRETGRAMASSWGLPAFPFLETPHPIANASQAELDARADRLVEPVVAILSARSLTS